MHTSDYNSNNEQEQQHNKTIQECNEEDDDWMLVTIMATTRTRTMTQKYNMLAMMTAHQ